MKYDSASQRVQDVQDMLQLAPFGTFQSDMQGNCVFVNQEWERITGLAAKASLGRNWLDAIIEADRPSLRAALDEALANQRDRLTLHYRVQHPQNGVRHCRADTIVVSDGIAATRYIIGYVQDITEQHQSRKRLKQAEKRQRELTAYLHSMIAVIEDIIFELDGEMVFRNVWVRDESLLFMPKEHLINKSIDEIFGDHASLFAKPVAEAIETGVEAVIEYRHVDPAIEKWYRAKVVPVEKSKNLKEYRLALIIQDISERTRYLDDLRLEKEKLARHNALYDFSNDLAKIAGWEFDIVTKKIVGTKQLYLIVERDPETVSPEEAAYEFLDAPSRAHLERHIELAITQKTPYDIELGVVTLKKNRKWVRSIGLPMIENDTVVKVRGVMMDITEQVLQRKALTQAQDELARNNHLLDFSQKLSATGGWEFNLKTRKTYWTKQVYAIYEVPEDFDTSDAEQYLSFFSPDDQQLIQGHMNRCFAERQDYVFEVQATLRQGHTKWVRVFGAPIVQDDAVTGTWGAVMDITQEKEDAILLLRAKEAAEEAAKAKADFLSVMSHEIRTPLNGIIGIANLLKLKHTEEQKEIVNSLLFSADHLLRLINDVLDLSKMESDKLELAQVDFNLSGLVRSIRNQFASLADAKGIRLVCLLDPEIPERLVGDPTRLSQIINNLVSNAVKYTDKGSVTLSIQLLERDEQTANLHFSVKDTGVGIPEALHQAIFEDFRQAQQDLQREHAGTGLGLAITKRLIELYDSQIYVDSQPNKGAEFHFDLRFAAIDGELTPIVPAISKELAAYEGRLATIRLLLVEDNRVNVMVTRELLAYFGIAPDCAVGGKEALELLGKNAYHVAFVDLHMPGMDGYALAKIMREQYPETQIIVFTADIMSGVRVKFAQLGIHDILNKPFVPEQMLDILLDVMQKKGLNG